MATRTQRILGVNTPFESLKYKDFTEISFKTNVSFMDYDAVIIGTKCLAGQYETDYPDVFQGKRAISKDASFRMIEDYERTKGQIVEVLKQGKNVFVLMAKNENCFVHTGQTSISGTGKNALTQNFVTEFNAFCFLPISLKPTMVTGTTVQVVCQSPYASFFQATEGMLYYNAYFTAQKGSALLTIPNSDKAVSAVFQCEKGRIVLLPYLYEEFRFETTKEWKNYGKKFLDALFELNHALMACEDSYSLPLWTDGIKILDEEDQEKKLEQDFKKLENIKSEIAKREALVNKIRRKKILLTASGTILEEVVKETLQEIGFTLHKVEAGRSDVIASYEGTDVVAEIKGVTKSAAEKHAAQLEKWVAQFMEEKEHSPKALLIVNGYCDTPLSERTEEVFPDQMLPYCKSRDHALVTTTQLLCLYTEIKNNPACAKERISELLSCTGIYPRYADYGKYLRLNKQDEDETDE